jgi:predicted nuclease of predicted toxin-antitoxin system
MKLLFDENLSPKLTRLLAADFPGSAHVRDRGLKGQSDERIWEYAKENGFTLVSKDTDFYLRCLLYGIPPKLIWLRLGNCTREDSRKLLLENRDTILGFESATEYVLALG